MSSAGGTDTDIAGTSEWRDSDKYAFVIRYRLRVVLGNFFDAIPTIKKPGSPLAQSRLVPLGRAAKRQPGVLCVLNLPIGTHARPMYSGIGASAARFYR